MSNLILLLLGIPTINIAIIFLLKSYFTSSITAHFNEKLEKVKAELQLQVEKDLAKLQSELSKRNIQYQLQQQEIIRTRFEKSKVVCQFITQRNLMNHTLDYKSIRDNADALETYRLKNEEIDRNIVYECKSSAIYFDDKINNLIDKFLKLSSSIEFGNYASALIILKFGSSKKYSDDVNKHLYFDVNDDLRELEEKQIKARKDANKLYYEIRDALKQYLIE